MKRQHLITAAIIIGIGIMLVGLYVYSARETKQEADWCATKGLLVYEIGDKQVCRDRDTGLLYAPPAP